MIEIPIIRWGEPYESMEQMEIVHFETGESLAKVHEANGGLIKMDMRKSKRAREILREFSIDRLVEMVAEAAYEGDYAPPVGTMLGQELGEVQLLSFEDERTHLWTPEERATLLVFYRGHW